MKTIIKTRISIAIISFLLGLLVYDVFLIDLYIDSKTPDKNDPPTELAIEYVQCPNEANFNEVWNQWSYEYINGNPYADVDEQMSTWNALMVQNGCPEHWFDPLSELIEQHGASGTPVYWYE